MRKTKLIIKDNEQITEKGVNQLGQIKRRTRNYFSSNRHFCNGNHWVVLWNGDYMSKTMRRKPKNKYNARKIEFGGHVFDSLAERDFYLILKNDKTVKDIELQPQYEIIKPYKVKCGRCDGRGKVLNTKTLNLNKCTLCKGYGTRTKQGAKYTADFKVTYIDGEEKVIDVKGGPTSKDFTLRKKLFEVLTGKELVIAKKTGKGWEVK